MSKKVTIILSILLFIVLVLLIILEKRYPVSGTLFLKNLFS